MVIEFFGGERDLGHSEVFAVREAVECVGERVEVYAVAVFTYVVVFDVDGVERFGRNLELPVVAFVGAGEVEAVVRESEMRVSDRRSLK